jgi:hypothetical protein
MLVHRLSSLCFVLIFMIKAEAQCFPFLFARNTDETMEANTSKHSKITMAALRSLNCNVAVVECQCLKMSTQKNLALQAAVKVKTLYKSSQEWQDAILRWRVQPDYSKITRLQIPNNMRVTTLPVIISELKGTLNNPLLFVVREYSISPVSALIVVILKDLTLLFLRWIFLSQGCLK